MADYIEREAAIAETRKPRLTDAELRRRLSNIPAADVVEVVRCKDCRCGERVDLYGNPAIECRVYGETQPLHWYCAGGEPKE